MRKSLIVATTPSGVIGNRGALPWHLPEDLKRFRRLTSGHPIIMGRKTYASLGRPLPNRTNIVVSRDPQLSIDGVTVVTSIEAAWSLAEQMGATEAFCIGGREIYQHCLGVCDRLYLTILRREFPGDTYLHINLADWEIRDYDHVGGLIPHHNLILEKRTPMSMILTLERLDNNYLPQPRYQTPQAAGLDFAACLTRPCRLVEPGTTNMREFKVNGDFWAWKNTVPLLQTISLKHKVSADYDQICDPDAALIIHPNETIMIPLGFKCSFSTVAHFQIHIRSSIGLKGLVLANGTGIVDPDYRGELFAVVRNVSIRSRGE
jgi:dihydrofolate reductase